jgi:hypothetical protein
MMWKEDIVALFKILTSNLPIGTQKNMETSGSSQAVNMLLHSVGFLEERVALVISTSSYIKSTEIKLFIF